MTKFMVCLDVETTGLDKTSDRIIQLCITKFESKTGALIDTKNWYIKPSGSWNIDASATEVHGITNDFIEKNGVSLKDIYKDFEDFVGSYDFLTYNGNAFDWCFIQREFEREGIDPKFTEHNLYDSFIIETTHNSHKLSDVYKRYFGEGFEDAHDASADVKATIKVFVEQQKRYDDIEEINKDPQLQTTISPEGFVRVDESGDLIFAAGKYRSKKVVDVVKSDLGYLRWLNENNVITLPTKRAIKLAWENHKKNN